MNLRGAIWVVFSAAMSVLAYPAMAAAQNPGCDDLVGLKLDNGVVERVEPIAAGDTLVLGESSVKPKAPLAFCRVFATLKPIPDSEIRIEVWLPAAEAWNGKFLGSGSGGFGGVLRSSGLYLPLRQGYAGAVTDMGHEGNVLKAEWAYGHPERVVDWAHRANHVTALAAKQLIGSYYGKAPTRSYFHGCSDGGREALMEAYRYPDDYDGIIAGAPAAAFTDLMTQAAWNHNTVASTDLAASKFQLLMEAARTKLGFNESKRAAKMRLIDEAVLAQCDALDGVEDGLLEYPPDCSFTAAELQCGVGQRRGCLTAAEAKAVQAVYDGPRTQAGTQVSSGFSVGGESIPFGWSVWITGPLQGMMATDFFRWMVYGDKSWKLEHFDLDRDWAAAEGNLAESINADMPDLDAFVRRGGKLLLYHGWWDAALPAGNTISYYKGLQRHLGPETAQHARLFMMPGMAHCFLGPGPNVFDALTAMDDWVEGRGAPSRIIATKFDNDEAGLMGLPAKALRTRPLCAWPMVARWDGEGSIDDATSFACIQPE